MTNATTTTFDAVTKKSTVQDLTSEEKAAKKSETESLSSEKRRIRTNLLAETDWMASSDYTMSDSWKTYRQALRDLPAQSGFPDVDFPTKPS